MIVFSIHKQVMDTSTTPDTFTTLSPLTQFQGMVLHCWVIGASSMDDLFPEDQTAIRRLVYTQDSFWAAVAYIDPRRDGIDATLETLTTWPKG